MRFVFLRPELCLQLPSDPDATLFAGTGFVDGKGTPVVLLAVEGGDGRLRLVIVGHLDEPESLAAAGVAVVDDLSREHLAVLAEQLFQFRAIDVVAQVSHVQLLSHCDVSYEWLQAAPFLEGKPPNVVLSGPDRKRLRPTDAGDTTQTEEGRNTKRFPEADRQTRHLSR